MEIGKRLAFDYGSTRIGVATSDEAAIICTPHPAINNDSELKSNLSQLIEEINPKYIVVGLPKQLSGAQGNKIEEVTNFIAILKNITALPLYAVDERFTTISAAQKLRNAGYNSKDSKTLIDSAAAVEILESALDLEKHGNLSRCAI